MTATATRASVAPGSRELVLVSVAIAAAGRFTDGPLAWLAAGLLVAGVAVGALQVLADDDPAIADLGVPVESVIVPTLAAFATFTAIRVVPVGILLIPALALGGWLIRRALAAEAVLLRSRTGPTDAERTAILVEVLAVAFLGFVGIAALVPGGLPDLGFGLDGAGVGTGADAPTGAQLAILALGDALVAFLAGYRAAALRTRRLRDVAWAALTGGSAVGIAAAAVRAIEVPRLLGPALLTVVLFLWDTVHSGATTSRRDPRRLWEALLLIGLAVLVTVWSLRLRG